MTFLKKNTNALIKSKQLITVDWLTKSVSELDVKSLFNLNKQPILIVDGLSFCSRYKPIKEAEIFIEQTLNSTEKEIFIFGLGAGYHLLVALAKFAKVYVFEADPKIAQLALTWHDFSPYLEKKEPSLILLCPWHLNSKKDWPENIEKLVKIPHRPSLNKFKALWLKINRKQEKTFAFNKTEVKSLIIPPLGGGSLSIACYLAKAWQDINPQTSLVNLEDLQILFQKDNIKNRTDNNFLKKAEEIILKEINEQKPQLVFALAQAPLSLLALEKIKKQNIKTAFWFVEDFRIFPYVQEIAPAYDYFFHIQKNLIEPHLKNWGVNNAYYLPLASDPDLFKKQTPKKPYLAELSFMGAGYPNRQAFFSRLLDDNAFQEYFKMGNFKIFGDGWQNSSKKIKKYLFANGRRISLDECPLIYSSSQININLHSSLKANSLIDPSANFINPRTFEIASSSGFQLIDERPLLFELFEKDDEIISFSNFTDFNDKLIFYLKHPQLRNKIAKKSRKRILAQHTYQLRVEEIIKIIK